jgi:large subunit ribosomal protein L6
MCGWVVIFIIASLIKNNHMSRIGKQQLNIPTGVEVKFSDTGVIVKGPKGELTRALRPDIEIKMENNIITSTPRRNDKFSRALWGTYMSHIKNMIQGVVTPFEKRLLVEGVGFKWEVKGTDLHMSLGFSHPVVLKIPTGLTVTAEKGALNISGIDKELVGLFANQVRSKKKPEPYKGKGIRYSDEVIRRKQGKKAA